MVTPKKATTFQVLTLIKICQKPQPNWTQSTFFWHKPSCSSLSPCLFSPHILFSPLCKRPLKPPVSFFFLPLMPFAGDSMLLVHRMIFSPHHFRPWATRLCPAKFSLGQKFRSRFYGMKPSISNLVKSLWYSCLVILFFGSSIFLFCKDSAVFENLNSLSHLAVFLYANLLRPAALDQFRPHPLPRIARIFSTPNQILALPVHSPWPHHVRTDFSLSKMFIHILRTCAISWLLHVLCAFSTSHASILLGLCARFRSMFRLPPILIDENPSFFQLRLQLFTIFPFLYQAVKAGCILQGCENRLFSLARLYSSTKPSSSIAPAFANTSTFALP